MAPFRYSVIAAVFLGVASVSASALTAEDVTKRMNVDQRHAYVVGLINMLAYDTARTGDKERSACITKTFLLDGMEASWVKIHQVLDEFPDKPPEVLVAVLARQLCK
jgi:hypothetical protein